MTDTPTAVQPGVIDFTEMNLTHDAFRRDLDRLAAAAAAGKGRAPGVVAGWANFKKQLLVHHSVEDAWLWPRLARRVAGRPERLALLTDMEAEHARLDPLLEAVERALAAGSAELPALAAELAETLGRHLAHEEQEALPLIQSVMTPKDWGGFRRAMARRQGLRGASVWIPWITDGMTPSAAHAFLGRMPAPLRFLTYWFWGSRYKGRKLWKY